MNVDPLRRRIVDSVSARHRQGYRISVETPGLFSADGHVTAPTALRAKLDIAVASVQAADIVVVLGALWTSADALDAAVTPNVHTVRPSA
ncbi:MAG: hypothetical protein ACJAZO_003522 [Myxococcota bacterium]